MLSEELLEVSRGLFKRRKRTRLSQREGQRPQRELRLGGGSGAVRGSHPPAGLARRPRSVPESPGPPRPFSSGAAGALSSARPRPVPSSVRGKTSGPSPAASRHRGRSPAHPAHSASCVYGRNRPRAPGMRGPGGVGGPLCGAELPKRVGAREPGAPEGAGSTDRRATHSAGLRPPSPPPHPTGRARGAAALLAPTRRSQAVVSTHTLAHAHTRSHTLAHAHTRSHTLTHTHAHTRTCSESRRLRHARSHAPARPRSHV